jgi:hypothetical protein
VYIIISPQKSRYKYVRANSKPNTGHRMYRTSLTLIRAASIADLFCMGCVPHPSDSSTTWLPGEHLLHHTDLYEKLKHFGLVDFTVIFKIICRFLMTKWFASRGLSSHSLKLQNSYAGSLLMSENGWNLSNHFVLLKKVNFFSQNSQREPKLCVSLKILWYLLKIWQCKTSGQPFSAAVGHMGHIGHICPLGVMITESV